MKKIACLFCGLLLLLTSCADQAIKLVPTQKIAPTMEVTAPAVTPTPEATATPAPETVAPTITPTPEIVPTEEPDELTQEAARTLIEQANAALGPFLGEGAVESGQDGWLLLEGFDSKAEILAGLTDVFQDRLAEHFFFRYEHLIFREENGAVYVRTDSRDILGHYYDMDLDTLTYEPDLTQFIFSEEGFTVDGFGNGPRHAHNPRRGSGGHIAGGPGRLSPI